jgi:hypothetical protein
LVHFVHVQHQVVRPGEGGLQVQGGGVGHGEFRGLSLGRGIIVDGICGRFVLTIDPREWGSDSN